MPPIRKAHAEYLAKRKPLEAKWDAFVKKQEALVFEQHRRQTAQYLLLSRDPAKIAELDGEAFGLSDRKILRTGSARWLKTLEKLDPNSDPIFAPWFAFAALPSPEFADRAKVLSAKIAANSLARPVNSLVARAFAGEPPIVLEGCGGALRQTVRGSRQAMARAREGRCQVARHSRIASRKRCARCSTARTAPETCRPS